MITLLLLAPMVAFSISAFASAGPYDGEQCFKQGETFKNGSSVAICEKQGKTKKLIWKLYVKPSAVSPAKKPGHWETKCAISEVANPNYNAAKGYSAVVNEPTIRVNQCQQVWVN